MVRLSSFLLGAVTLVAHTNAHTVMTNPFPIGHINNSPVKNSRNPASDPNGGEYPCKNTGTAFFDNPKMNTAKPGDTLKVTFRGSAVHGGGSCQFSLTKDVAPNQNSVFKVIHSVEGGCPARNKDGNFLPDNADFVNPNQYPVKIPNDLKPGRYTFAWTWLNKVGNREFYMNCAAMQIGSGTSNTGSDPFWDSLPDMTLVNTNADTCERKIGSFTFKYAFPGTSVEQNEDLSNVDFEPDQCFAGGKKIKVDVKTGAGSASKPTVIATATAIAPDMPTGFATGKPASLTTSTTTRSTSTTQGGSSTIQTGSPNIGGVDGSPLSSTKPDCTKPCTKPGFECMPETSSFRECAAVGDCAVIRPLAVGVTCDAFGIQSIDDTNTIANSSTTSDQTDTGSDAKVKRRDDMHNTHAHAHAKMLRHRRGSRY